MVANVEDTIWEHDFADAGVVCGNCAQDLCNEEVERGCFECNHRPQDNTCLNYGDGHCKWCGQCVEPERVTPLVGPCVHPWPAQ